MRLCRADVSTPSTQCQCQPLVSYPPSSLTPPGAAVLDCWLPIAATSGGTCATTQGFLTGFKPERGDPPQQIRDQYLPLFISDRLPRRQLRAAARTNESKLAGGHRFKLAVCAATSACSRRFQRAIARFSGRTNSHSSHHGLSTTCRTCAPHPSVDARTNRQRSRTTGLLLPMVAIRAFGWVSSMSTDHLAGGAPPVFELCQLIVTALLFHAAGAPPEQPRQRREARPGVPTAQR
eukprot:COSAG06_NODE_2955_length_6030_cov_410.210312_6_plen_235_part_00